MRTRAYKEDVTTQPRSAREFALQTLCSFTGKFFKQKTHPDDLLEALKVLWGCIDIQKEIGMEVRISVRGLVEFILRSGDIDNRRRSSSENAMAEGSRIHRMIQRRMGSEYMAEVSLSYRYATEQYDIVVDGRADGIINGDLVTVDEIKGTYRHLDKMNEPVAEHLAQAKCYAYIYAREHMHERIRVRMTYCNLDTEDIRYFYETYDFESLEKWFLNVMEEYKKWTDYRFEWNRLRQASIKEMVFPFAYREGQKELATYVYQTIVHKRKLFLEAPTGVGKTISTVFPAIKAMGEGKADRLFYLTAKTIAASVAENTFTILRERGLQFKSVLITAKEKICFMEECECNPENCPYAKGHFDRINDAMYDLLTHEAHFSRTNIETYARKHMVCPFEMSLDMSLFADAVICDYNYLFDPHVYLKRFFAESKNEKYLFLIDEAHNLVDRGREMYSATLVKEDFLTLKKRVKVYDKKLEKRLEACNHQLLILKKECETHCRYETVKPFYDSVERLNGALEDYLENHEESPIRKEVLEFYFKISHFLLIYEKLGEEYIIYSAYDEAGNFYVRLYCVDPAVNLKECMDKGEASVLFSATLLPIQYYKKLLGGTSDDYEVYAKSTFHPEKRALLIGRDVTSKYSMRSTMQYRAIAEYIHRIIKGKKGNYMVFFPSHHFLKQVYQEYDFLYGDESSVECILQQEYMKEEDRAAFLGHFIGNDELQLEEVIHMDIDTEEMQTLVGFCVMGGIFSEGIDLKNDSLIGAVIVGTGIPQVCLERELMKDFFDEKEENGYEYAYLFPGMNKVLQSAGRVIRTHEDRGVIALLDERFCYSTYRNLFPREWNNYKVVDKNNIEDEISCFWAEQDAK